MTREAKIEEAARGIVNAWFGDDGSGDAAVADHHFAALRAALAQPPVPAPSMEEVERLVQEHAIANLRLEHRPNDPAAVAAVNSAHAALLAAIRALPDRYAEGWAEGAAATRADDVEYLRQLWDDGDQGNANDAAELHLLRTRALPTPNPEDRR